MDTGMGNFAELSETKAKELESKNISIFRTGEEVTIKDSKFVIHDFNGKFLVLRVLPK